MKIKFNKKISISIIIGLITILTIIGIVLLSNSKLEENDNFNIVTEIDNTRVSGASPEVANIKINIITKNEKDYDNYSNIVHNIEHEFNLYKLNEVMFINVTIFDKNGKEIILKEPMTIYLDNTYIDINNGYFEKAIINKDNTLSAYDMTISNYPNNTNETCSEKTVIYFDIKETSTFAIINYIEKDAASKDVFTEVVVDTNKIEDEKSALETVNKNYKIKELTQKEIEKKYGIKDPNLTNSINYINKLDGIILQRYETDQSATTNSEDDFNIIYSDDALVFLYSQTDHTKNYLTNERENFEEVFGFNYKDCSGAFDVFDKLLKNMGLNIEYENVTFDKEWYAITKECIYDIKEKDKFIQIAFPDLKYDSIKDTIVSYELGVYYDPALKQNIYNINQVTIAVYYEIDDTVRLRSLVLSATYTTEEIIDKYYINGEIGLQ